MSFRNRFSRAHFKLQLIALLSGLFFSILSAALNAGTTYDLNADWSDAANPNGAWSYRHGTTLLPHVNDWQGLSGDFTGVQPAWARNETGNMNLPPWMKIVSPAGVVNDWQIGDIVTHSTDGFNGIGSGPSNVIWTSPSQGVIDVSGSVWMGRDIGRGNHWDLSLNGLSLTSGNIFSGDAYDRSNPYLFANGSGGALVLSQIPVMPGDVLKLEITRTSEPGDYVGVNLTINAVPEPAGIVLSVIGLGGGLFFSVWRRRKR